MSQYTRIARLIQRKRGATAMEITQDAGTVSAHSRMSELKARGWTITRKPLPGKTYGTYHGRPPAEPCYFSEAGEADRGAARGR